MTALHGELQLRTLRNLDSQHGKEGDAPSPTATLARLIERETIVQERRRRAVFRLVVVDVCTPPIFLFIRR